MISIVENGQEVNCSTDTSNLGQFEPGDNALYSHAAGTTFIWKGQFVKVGSTAIGVGDSIGALVTPTTVSAILSELNSKSIK